MEGTETGSSSSQKPTPSNPTNSPNCSVAKPSPTSSKPIKKKIRRKEKGKPKRPLSAYNLFFEEIRKQLLRENGSTSGFKDLAQLVSAKWNDLTKSTDPKCIEILAKLKERATQLKEEYLVQVDIWRSQKEELERQNQSGMAGNYGEHLHAKRNDDDMELDTDASSCHVNLHVTDLSVSHMKRDTSDSPPFVPDEIQVIAKSGSEISFLQNQPSPPESAERSEEVNTDSNVPFTKEELEKGDHFDNDPGTFDLYGNVELYSSFTTASSSFYGDERDEDHGPGSNVAYAFIPPGEKIFCNDPVAVTDDKERAINVGEEFSKPGTFQGTSSDFIPPKSSTCNDRAEVVHDKDKDVKLREEFTKLGPPPQRSLSDIIPPKSRTAAMEQEFPIQGNPRRISSDVIPPKSRLCADRVEVVSHDKEGTANVQQEIIEPDTPTGPSESTLSFLMNEFDEDGISYLRNWLL